MQVTVISGLFAVLCYAAGSVFQGMRFTSKKDTSHLVMLFGCLAVFAHVVSAMSVIRTPAGYQFGIVEISTLVTAIGSLLVLVSSLRKPLENLFLGLFPLAILAIIASLTLRSDYPPTQLASGLASHVMLSILAYSVMTIAALQAVFLAYQNYKLKHGQAGGCCANSRHCRTWKCFCSSYSGSECCCLAQALSLACFLSTISFPGRAFCIKPSSPCCPG